MKPLGGIRIVVTRAAHQAEELARPLRDLGADIILLPTIGIDAPQDPARLQGAAARCNEYDWIIFTSVNAVQAFSAELGESGQCRTPTAVIGSATAQAAEQCGFTVSLIPEEYVAESVITAFEGRKLQGCRILIPSAAVTRDLIPQELRRLGAQVDVVEAYRNIVPMETARQAAEVFREPYPDWITFTSSSTVQNLLLLTGSEPLQHVSIATIGPVTSRTVEKSGLMVTVEAAVHTVPGLVEAIAGRY